MLFSSPIFRPVVSVSNNHERGQDEGGGGVTPLYKLYRYVLIAPREGFLGLFGLKTLYPFWSGIGYGFSGNYGSVHEWTHISFQFQMSKNEIEICQFEIHLENFLVYSQTW